MLFLVLTLLSPPGNTLKLRGLQETTSIRKREEQVRQGENLN